MAIYHISAKMISRGNGSSALAAAAYRSASRLHDQRLDRHHDFSNKAGVVHSEVMLPGTAPEEWRDREKLWNAVEAAEVRKDAQLAREIEFAVPRELDQAEGIRLAREFVQAEFVDRGMVADLNVHWDVDEDGLAKPHAHVMLTTREVGEDGFGAKVRDWNRTDLLERWRERWAEHVNVRLAELDIDARVDHRSLEAQGIDLEPQHKIGPAAARMAERGQDSERLVEHHAIARANGDKIIADPTIALDAITRQQATFTTRDLAMFVHRHSDDKEQFDRAMAAVRSSPEIVALGKDGRGQDRFTSREMLATEQRLKQATASLDAKRMHIVREADRQAAIERAASRGLVLSAEQRGAVEHVTNARSLSNVIGYAGTGKSAMLGVAREAWEASGYRVTGLALSGIAAENLEGGSGIASRTIASIEHQWGQGRELLSSNDVLVIDEAGMIGTRQMERVVREAERRGAKLVLVGDPEQLQAIEAGAAFRTVAERHGSVEITNIRRQREDWQRDATRQLATGRTGEALGAYEQAGHVHAADTREAARSNLVDRWDRDRRASRGDSHIILSHTRDEVGELNGFARERLRQAGELGGDVTIATTRGERQFARGDRIMFLRNEHGLGVKNGSLGMIESLGTTRMAVLLDDGRSVAFDTKDYADLDHGYASTIHKAQGVTVDRAYVLATPGLDRHAAYVALSRHRDGVELHYGQDDFADRDQLVRTLERERTKDMASDYAREPGGPVSNGKREIRLPAPAREPTSPKRSIFDGLRLRTTSPTVPARGPFDGLVLPTSPPPDIGRSPLETAVQRVGRAMADIHRLGTEQQPLPHQKVALSKAREALDAVRPHGATDLAAAFAAEPALVEDAAKGRTAAAIRAMQIETELRTDPELRADRFVRAWQQLRAQRDRLGGWENEGARKGVEQRMAAMGKGLERDPQVESLLRKKATQLGLPDHDGRRLSQAIPDWLSHSRDRGIGR
jgi:Ti-type conjugative transfer relaxase TraA